MPSSRKTVLRSVRLSDKLEQVLVKDAKMKGLSVNALVSSILERYAEWDRYTERFGFVTITRNGLRRMYDAIDDDKIPSVGQEIGDQNPRDMTLFWFGKLNIDSFFRYLSLISRYGKTLEYEVDTDGRSYTITIQQDIGRKHAVFLGKFIEQAIKSIVRVTPKCEVGQNSLVVKFSSPANEAGGLGGSTAHNS